MESQRYALRFGATSGAEVPDRDLVLFFHRLIQEKALRETCVDVADYSHVPGGPGVMLICHEAHYSLERVSGSLALRVAAKRGAKGDARARIRRIFGKALTLLRLAETHEVLAGRVIFDRQQATLWIEDRLVAPNTEATFAAFAPVLGQALTEVWGASPVLSRAGTPKERFQVDIVFPRETPIEELLGRLSPIGGAIAPSKGDFGAIAR